jgi:hypothetical protein
MQRSVTYRKRLVSSGVDSLRCCGTAIRILMRQQDAHVLDGCNEVILDLLAPEGRKWGRI